MSYRAITKRITNIDGRRRHRSWTGGGAWRGGANLRPLPDEAGPIEVERLSDRSIIVRFRTNQQSQVLFRVSQSGPNAEILQPPELRDRAREWFAGAAER